MNPAEILALVQAIVAVEPTVKDVYDKIAANSNGSVRPLDQIFSDTDATIAAGEAEAEKELGS